MIERLIRSPFIRTPAVYVLEIAGTPILAFEATSFAEARELAKEDWLKAELQNLRWNGLPVWDGEANIRIGPATGEDVANVTNLLQSGRGDEDLKLIYLVQLDGPPVSRE